MVRPPPIGLLPLAPLVLLVAGCGLGVSQIPEIWDRGDPTATVALETRIKEAIFCELRKGVADARHDIVIRRSYHGVDVTRPEDEPFPDSWGAQVELSLSADEKTTFAPGVSFKSPLSSRTIGLGSGPQSFTQSYATSLGAILSSQNYRQDKFDFFYSATELTEPTRLCAPETRRLGGAGASSPFVNADGLGVREWLPSAVAVVEYKRSSRAVPNGEGKALSMAGKPSDSATFDNRFVIVSDGSVAPVVNLVRVATPSTPLLDFNRTRTHELLITIGEAVAEPRRGARGASAVGLSRAASDAHLASQIGIAVSAAIRGY